MATLALGYAGTALGNAVFPGSIIGGITGGTILGGIGAVAGTFIDQMWWSEKPKPIFKEGPRLNDVKVTSSIEGAPILQVYGRMRVGGQMIWATNFHEVKTTTTQRVRVGKGKKQTISDTTYSYYGNFAIGLCEGEIISISRVWADGKEININDYTYRLYKGTEDQNPDPKIVAVEGVGVAPAYRGLAYIVFDELPLEEFGNRIPVLTVEVIRQPPVTSGVRLENILQSVTMIPSSGEFIYATTPITRDIGFGEIATENNNGSPFKADIKVALDQLEDAVPNIQHVSLVVAWHGTDLRCGSCEIHPKVEAYNRVTSVTWKAGGIDRSGALVVSSDADGPLLGGAPSDKSVVEAITEIKARGLAVTFYPFLLMDIPSDNTLPNPYGGTSQPAFPWRGRITCDPAPNVMGTVDKTAAAATQVASFFGTATPADLVWDGETVNYSGAAEWSFRRFILTCARLAQAAGGVENFIIGSEMIGLTSIRDSVSTFPAVGQFKTLAADVRSVVGSGTKIGYAADWTEYANYRPSDGSNDVYFHLDPLWSDSNIDFIGIDNYMPLADWRDGVAHTDALAGVVSEYELNYLQGNIEGGELFDWYYASAADRDAQVRTPINDGAYGKHWVFRFKDLRNWWLNPHYNRPSGVESVSPTAWVPQSKPIVFTEIGCPAVDKGANQPNVFFDPKSSESFLPYYSRGRRDDLAQRSFLEAFLDYWDPVNGRNPISTVYGGRMINMDRASVWTWDARPYPIFPVFITVWRDGYNWRYGHWLNGRLGLVPLRDLVADLCKNLGVPYDTSRLVGVVKGYQIDSIMSAREAIAALQVAYFFDGFESEGTIVFKHRGGAPVAALTVDDLCEAASGKSNSDFTLTRAQETELPGVSKLAYIDAQNDYRSAVLESRRLIGSSQRVTQANLGLVFDTPEAQGIVDTILMESHIERERIQFALPPSRLALEAGDVVSFANGSQTINVRMNGVSYEGRLSISGVRTEAELYDIIEGPGDDVTGQKPTFIGAPIFHFLDLPLVRGDETPWAPYLAGYIEPWSPVAVYRSPTSSGYELDVIVPERATVGRLIQSFPAGVTGRWDYASQIVVEIPRSESLESRDDVSVLGGANIGAIRNAITGEWEIVQWANAVLTAPNQYTLTKLLRGQFSTENAMSNPAPIGAPLVLLDANVVQSTTPLATRGLTQYWKYGPAVKSIDDPSFKVEQRAFAGIGLRPYSPVHLRATPSSGGDIVLSWIRRTRVNGDSWEQEEVLLGEDFEAYDVEILNAGIPVRTLATGTPSVTYTSAMQATDFGGGVSILTWRVYQKSATFGRGAKAETTSSI